MWKKSQHLESKEGGEPLQDWGKSNNFQYFSQKVTFAPIFQVLRLRGIFTFLSELEPRYIPGEEGKKTQALLEPECVAS